MRQRGIGLNPATLMVATDETLSTDQLPQPLPFFTLYDHYEIEVSYQSSNYPVLNDLAIDTLSSVWYQPPPAQANQQTKFTYAFEWQRYLTWLQVPQNDWITGIAGQSRFETGDNTLPGNADPTKAVSFQGMPRMWLPNQMVRLLWHQVPWRYVYSANSYLNRYLGMVNQFDFFDIGNLNFLFPAGSLLYLGYNPVSYMSPAAVIQQWVGGIDVTTMLVDLELIFLYTNRKQTNVPNVPNRNFIPSGHNLEPYFPLRNFFYTYFVDDSGNGAANSYPYWFSFPVELLFTDPDSPSINGF
jgi:hypothetical protein